MADEEEPKKKSGLLKIILLVVGAFVVLGIGLGWCRLFHVWLSEEFARTIGC